LKDAKEALASSDADVDRIRTTTEALLTVSQGFSQHLYEQASQQASQTSGPSSGAAGSSESEGSSDEEVVDAEIVEEPGT
jgi:molecular chaperone DnaK